MVCFSWLRNDYRELSVLLQMFRQCFEVCKISFGFLSPWGVVIMLSCKLMRWFLILLRNIGNITSICSIVVPLRMVLLLVRIELLAGFEVTLFMLFRVLFQVKESNNCSLGLLLELVTDCNVVRKLWRERFNLILNRDKYL